MAWIGRELLRRHARLTRMWTRRAYSKCTSVQSAAPRGLKWSYDFGTTSTPLLGSTVGRLLEDRAESLASHEAFVSVYEGLSYTYEQLLEQSDRLAAGLLALGLGPGDRLGIWAPSSMDWVVTQYAAARAGLVLVKLNPVYTVPELEYTVKKVGTKSLITGESLKKTNYYEMLLELMPELEHSQPGKLQSKRVPELTDVIMMTDKSLPGVFRFCDVMNMGNSTLRGQIKDLQDRLQFDDVTSIQFTSGTTGNPKGVALTHHNIVNNAMYAGSVLQYDTTTRLCLPVPLFHIFGMLLGNLAATVHGATVVIPSQHVDPHLTLATIQDERCTSVYGTPTMFIDLLAAQEEGQYDMSSMRTGMMAGSPCPPEVVRQTIDKLHVKDITIGFGMTENSSATFMTRIGDPLEVQVNTIGRVQPNTEAKIVDGDGRILRVGETGEVCIRGYCVMQGYWQDEEKTAEAISEDRWFRTGDLGMMDENGYVKIVGRLKDMIIRGGQNIYPVEIEEFLHTHPKIADVQVFGVSHKRLGEQTCAWIKLKHGESATAKEIKDFCKGQISYFKIPHYIEFVTEFPLTAIGKVKKTSMRELTEQQLTQ